MKKSLMLAAAVALSMASGAAFAEGEGEIFQWQQRVLPQAAQAPAANAAITRTYSVRSHSLFDNAGPSVLGGGDGNGG